MMISQDTVALLLVLLAMLFLIQRTWRLFFRRTAGCGTCAACPSSAADQPKLISLGPLPHITANSASNGRTK